MSRLPQLDPADRRLDAGAALRAAGLDATDGSPAKRMRVVAAVADLRPSPALEKSLDAQLLHGDTVRVLAERADWAIVKADYDGYVGWTRRTGLAAISEPTHVVTATTTFAYPGPDLKLPAMRALSMGSRVAVKGEAETRGTRYLQSSDGEWFAAIHLGAVGKFDEDYVTVARRLVGVPYLWGGGSSFGLDCSGFVQLAMRMCGRVVLRDSDMQAATIGKEIEPGPDYAELRRGDLIFWTGHVAIVTGDGGLLHANGASMDVRAEPLAEAVSRIARAFAEPIGYRRP